MDHIKILKRAFEITWRYRALWLIGLLLVLAGGGVGASFRPGPPGSPGDGSNVEFSGGPEYGGPGAWQKVVPILIVIGIVILLIILAVLLIGIIAAVVRYVTNTSLIRMVQSYEETEEKIGFWGGLRLGWSRSALYLWLIDLSLYLPLVLIVVLLTIPILGFATLAFVTATAPGIVLGIMLLLLFIPMVLLVVLIRVLLAPVAEIAHRACILQELGPWQAIRETFGLVRRQLGPVALQWLLLIGLGIAWSIVLVPVTLILTVVALFAVGLPALLLGGLIALVFSWPLGLAIGLLLFVPAFILLVAAPSIALTTLATVFYSTTWTLTYRELLVLDERETL